jgi:hypothetical protein
VRLLKLHGKRAIYNVHETYSETSPSKLASEGTLHELTDQAFRIDDRSLTLFRHQSQAVAKAKQRAKLCGHAPSAKSTFETSEAS